MQTPNNEPEDNGGVARNYTKYAGMAFKMGAIIVLGVLLGQWLDKKAGFTDPPIFVIVFSLLAVGLAIYSTVKDLIK